jgi:alkylation response protein AidB-like acyl-CoA dehydrogenase
MLAYAPRQSRGLSVQASDTTPPEAPRDLFNPTDEHRQLRDMVRSFVEKEVDPQALEYNRKEQVRWARSAGRN